MAHQDLNLDHWPPSLSEIADAFGILESTGRVTAIDMAGVDPTFYQEDLGPLEGSLWGAVLNPHTTPFLMCLHGENGATVTLRGPDAGPPTGPIHRTYAPPKPVPSPEDAAILQQVQGHASEDPIVLNTRGLLALLRHGRGLVEETEDLALQRKGVYGHRVQEGAPRVPIVIQRTPEEQVEENGRLRYLSHDTEDEILFTPREFVAVRKFGRDIFTIETQGSLLKAGILGYKEWVDAHGVARKATVRIRKEEDPMHRVLNLDHWPPVLGEIADAFAIIEGYDMRVERIEMGDADPVYYTNAVDQEAGGLWGAEMVLGTTPNLMVLRGGEYSATLRGPGAGPPTGPIYKMKVPPPYVPTESDLEAVRKFVDHTGTDDLILTPKEFMAIRRLCRNEIDLTSEASLLKQGILGTKLGADGKDLARIVTRRAS